jgi:hypothetical protein
VEYSFGYLNSKPYSSFLYVCQPDVASLLIFAGCVSLGITEGMFVGETTRFGNELILFLLLTKAKIETARINIAINNMGINHLIFP